MTLPPYIPVLRGSERLNATEAGEQETVIQWRDTWVDRFPALALLFHPANGEKRNVVTAVRLKKMGVVAGVPDLMLPCRGEGLTIRPIGLAIELKVGKNTVSNAQIAYLDRLFRAGWECVVAYSAERAVETIVRYLGMPKEALL